MLRYATKVGAKVFEETKVTALEFAGEAEQSYPVAAEWKSKSGNTGKISFDHVIDASGRAGILSVKYLHNREYNDTLKNVASWGYWKGTGKYLPGTSRENSPFFEALTGMTTLRLYLKYRANARHRRIWLGLVHPSSRWDYLRWSRSESREIQQEESRGESARRR